MASDNVLDKITGVKVVKPSEQVVGQIRRLINENVIKPGDILPSERELAKRFEVSKGYVREGIKALELYGVLRSVPGVGTIVSDLGKQCVGDFINNYVQFSIHDYVELLEVRALVEPFTAYRAAMNATDEELDSIGAIFEKLDRIVEKDEVSFDLECRFHLEIAKASHNGILAATMNAILPGLIQLINELDLAQDGRLRKAHMEHSQLYDALRRRDPQAAEQAMHHHMQETGVHFSVRISDIEVKRQSQRLRGK